MTSILETASIINASLIFGGMVFFAAFMAPLIFIKLPAEVSGKFIREVFPWYYLVFGIFSFLLTLILIFQPNKWLLGIMFANVFLFLFARQWLMPAINASRDENLQGNMDAKKKFDNLHRISVIINSIQLLSVLVVLYYLINPS